MLDLVYGRSVKLEAEIIIEEFRLIQGILFNLGVGWNRGLDLDQGLRIKVLQKQPQILFDTYFCFIEELVQCIHIFRQ